MRNQIKQTLILQYALALVFLAATGIWGQAVILSALVGCLAGLVPNTYIGIRMISVAENKNAMQWLGYAYRSEIGKWLITGSIFMLAFSVDYPWEPVILFAGFSLIALSGWLAPLVIKE